MAEAAGYPDPNVSPGPDVYPGIQIFPPEPQQFSGEGHHFAFAPIVRPREVRLSQRAFVQTNRTRQESFSFAGTVTFERLVERSFAGSLAIVRPVTFQIPGHRVSADRWSRILIDEEEVVLYL